MRWLCLFFFLLTGCSAGRSHERLDEHTTVTHVADFSAWLVPIDLLCCVGIAFSIAALIWIPIQKWIPMAGITFFGGLIVTAYSVAWLIAWLPYLIGAGFIVLGLWLVIHYRSLLLGIRRGWNEPQDAPNPPIIEKVLLK
jgi:hypothetical protein